MPDAIHSPTVAPPFPHARISELVEQAGDLFSDYCTSKERARDAAEYLAFEDLTGTFERLFQALNHPDLRQRGPPGQGPGRAAPNQRAAGRLVAQLQEGR